MCSKVSYSCSHPLPSLSFILKKMFFQLADKLLIDCWIPCGCYLQVTIYWEKVFRAVTVPPAQFNFFKKISLWKHIDWNAYWETKNQILYLVISVLQCKYLFNIQSIMWCCSSQCVWKSIYHTLVPKHSVGNFNVYHYDL